MVAYHGGPVLASVVIHPLYYGGWDSAGIEPHWTYLSSLAAYLSGGGAPSGMQPTLRQYGVHSVGVAPAVTRAPSPTAPRKLPPQLMLGIIADAQEAGEIPPFGPNVLIILFLAPDIVWQGGPDYGGTCQGFHASVPVTGGSFGVVPLGCRPDLPGYDQALTAHEVFEALTDPSDDGINTGWDEVADPCGGPIDLPFGVIAAPYDNLLGACSTTGFTDRMPAAYEYGYVWADDPTGASSLPDPTYQETSSSQPATMLRLATGHYELTFPGLNGSSGTVQVSPYGTAGEMTTVERWVPSGSDAQVLVRMFDAKGQPSDGRFTAIFTIVPGSEISGQEISYVWANEPSSASYTPAVGYQHRPDETSPINVRRLGVGDYVVHMPGVGGTLPGDPHNGGIVHASLYGPTAGWAQVAWWERGSSDLTARVLCFGPAGSPADSRFTLSHHRRADVGGRLWVNHAYAWCHDELASTYRPALQYQYSTQAEDLNVQRLDVGQYRVVMARQDLSRGHVQVTTYGYAPRRTEIERWAGDSIWVQTFDPSGARADSQFTISFSAPAT